MLLETVSLTRGQYDKLSVCWNNLFRRIFNTHKWESVKLIQYYCDRLDFTRLCRLRFLHKMSSCMSLSRIFLVLQFQSVLKSCSMSIMLISVCRYMLLMVLCIVNSLVFVVCDLISSFWLSLLCIVHSTSFCLYVCMVYDVFYFGFYSGSLSVLTFFMYFMSFWRINVRIGLAIQGVGFGFAVPGQAGLVL